ncbi:MAG: efflux RND transporter periplasmic adaptor subunit, partial [Planctomycetaceae bacterium]|nr:efflux RND transporter periplasmic adaptor subunit [Planctomycetaceae bacterium]
MSNEQKPVLSFFQRRAFLLSALGGGLAGLVGAIALPEGWLIAAPAGKAGDGGTTSGKSEAFYACPMFCTRLDKPGTCPVCGMDLERFVDTGAMLELTERERMAMGVKSAPVQRLQLAREIRTLGQFEPDESLDRVVSAWVAGRIDRLYADFTGVTVSEGDHLFDLYSPELYVAHRELKVAQQSLANKTPGADRLVELSREKL